MAASILPSAPSVGDASRAGRLRAIRELVSERPIGSQRELADALRDRGMPVTQATVSRDIAELGLVKVPGIDGHTYVAAEDLAAARPTTDRLLGRLLADIPVRVGRSGLILVLTASPGTASSIAQAIDQSSLTEQEGTLAGDNTVLVLFADEARLLRWQGRFEALQPGRSAARSGRPGRRRAGTPTNASRTAATRPTRRAQEVHR
ncbi:MAG: arginine repressor [Candidatus Limnocylindrales bacterium]